MRNMCTNCPKRLTCKTLCSGAEAYANQDWKDDRFTRRGDVATPMSNDGIESLNSRRPQRSVWDEATQKPVNVRKLTLFQQKINAYKQHLAGRTTREIAKDFCMRKSQIAAWIQEMQGLDARAKDQGLVLEQPKEKLPLAEPRALEPDLAEIFDEAVSMSDGREPKYGIESK